MAKGNYSIEFKSRVALAAIRGDKTLSEIASEYDVHPNQISRWKKEALENFSAIFTQKRKGNKELKEKQQELDVALKKLGEMTVENEWFKKKLKPYL
ncbi:MAG: transposase [Clostridia bacterium]|nr:transposase [Clostridia bacterium]